ncbi:hypothetical protein TRAPUB_7763 [Trametes pubescens]|uniref:Uncharacterized protein n=1 Tax=Trametes pubescens TaxID=154538 RepID=A0A1M2V2D0_TRAPU|nr:hypothetical protein TRAPUB_7763 [Trametes pubescens]
MSAALFGDVIVDINDILRALQAHDQHKPSLQYDRPPGLPFPIAVPAPQRPPSDFATILLWEEPEEERPASEMEDTYVHNKDAYLRSGGLYTQRLLAGTRAMATSFRRDQYRARATADSTTSNEAPPWPPAPELIASPPNWGLATTPGQSEGTPANADSDATGSDDDWSTNGWSSGDSSQEETDGEAEDTCATGYFIGRDGMEWPMPPPECMPGGFLSTHPSPYGRLGTCSPTTAADSLSGYDTSEDGDAELEAVEGRVVWSAEGYDGYSDSDSDSEEYDALDGYAIDQLGHPNHSPPPPLSHSAGNSPSSGFAPSPATHPSAPSTPVPHGLSLAELGRQWYASFGKDLNPVPPSTSSTGSYTPHMSLGPAPHLCWRPHVEEDTRARKAHHKPSEEQRYFLGRDGSAWPLPPPPPDAEECALRRGRIRKKKW